MERMGFGYEALSQDQPAHHLRLRLGLRPERAPMRTRAARTSWPRRCRASWRASPIQSLPTSIYATALADYSAGMHLVQGILLALAAAREDRRRPAGLGVALQFDARHADAGSGDVAAAQARAQLGRLPADRRVRDHGRRGRDRGRLQGQPAAGHLPRARACPICRPIRTSPPSPGRSRTRPELQAAVPQQALDRHHGPLARAARGAGSPLRAGADAGRGAGVRADRRQRHDRVARRQRQRPERAAEAGGLADHHGSPSAFRLRHAPPRPRRARRRRSWPSWATRPIASPNCARARCFHDHPLRRRGPRRARHHRPARPHERHRRGDRSRADPHLGGDRTRRPRSAASCSPAPASAPSAPAPT